MVLLRLMQMKLISKKKHDSVLEERKRNHEEGAQLIDENIGSVMGQMSGL